MAKKNHRSNYILAIAALGLVVSGVLILWTASLRIPALEDISERKIDQSTKIYDRTGEILLYDMSRDVRRERLAVENISPYIVAATVAIEDKNFYSHNGFRWTSFLRAVLVNLSTLSFSQGGSTITQQVVKNSILTKDKTPTRKLKELVLAIKLEKILTKSEILSLYLNEISYGGTVYGVGEAEYEKAKKEKVEFKPRLNTGGTKAPHFVFFVLNFLAKRYGEDALQNGNYKIITTLDYSLQEKAEA